MWFFGCHLGLVYSLVIINFLNYKISVEKPFVSTSVPSLPLTGEDGEILDASKYSYKMVLSKEDQEISRCNGGFVLFLLCCILKIV